MKTLITNQADFMKRHESLSARVAVLESKDSRDSERFKGIADEIRRTMNNSTRIDTLNVSVSTLEATVQELKARSNRGDILNALAAAIAAAIGWIR